MDTTYSVWQVHHDGKHTLVISNRSLSEANQIVDVARDRYILNNNTQVVVYVSGR
jgi:hypothetical protein